MPVLVLFGIALRFFIHPLTQLILGQDREFIEIFGTVVIVRRSSGLLKARAVKGNIICRLHQFMHTFLLCFQNPVAVFAADGLSLHLHISLQ